MQLLELSVGVVIGHLIVLHIRVAQSRISWMAATHLGLSIRPIVHITALGDFTTLTTLHRAHTLAIGTSREGGALVFDDLLKYIVKDFLGIVRIADLGSHA
jgi:hypothetical protein